MNDSCGLLGGPRPTSPGRITENLSSYVVSTSLAYFVGGWSSVDFLSEPFAYWY